MKPFDDGDAASADDDEGEQRDIAAAAGMAMVGRSDARRIICSNTWRGKQGKDRGRGKPKSRVE